MPTSLTDQMFGQGKEGSLTDQMFSQEKEGNLTDQLFGAKEVQAPTTVAPTENLPKVTANQLYDQYMEKKKEQFSGDKMFPSHVVQEDIGLGDKIANVAKDTFIGLGDIITHPIEVARGIADIGANMPGFLTGLVDAGRAYTRTVFDQVVLGQTLDLEQAYNISASYMKGNMEYFKPTVDKIINPILGKHTAESELAMQVAMAPVTAMSMMGHSVANADMFKDSPNIRGAARLIGDITGLVAMGMIVHGPSGKAKFAKGVENVVKKADELNKEVKAVNQNPNEIFKQAQLKVLEIEKTQLELEAKRIAEKVAKDAEIKAEKDRQVVEIEKAKVGKVESKIVESDRFEIKQTGNEKIVEEVNKVIPDTEFKYDGEFNRSALNKGPLYQFTPQKGEFAGRTITVEKLSAEAVKKKFEEVINKKEPDVIKAIDVETGTPNPISQGKESPFYQDAITTEKFKGIYEERPKAVQENIEVFTQKLINDVNRWEKGEEIPIDQVREGLSNLAVRADEMRAEFITGQDHLAWKEIVSEAASWARKLDRFEMERTEQPVKFTKEQRMQMIKDAHEKVYGAGIKLTSGVDPTEGIKAIIAGAKGVSEYVKKARGVKDFKPLTAARLVKEEFTRSFIDRSGNIRSDLLNKLGDQGYNVIQKMYLSKGASSQSASMLKQMQKEIYSGLSGKEKQILDNVILSDRVGDIAKYKSESQFKYPKGLEPKNVVAYSELFGEIEGLTPVRAAEIRNRAKGYFEWMKKPLKDMLESGLIDQAEYNSLSSHNYRRLKLVEVYDKRSVTKVGKRMKTVYDSGVEALSRGRDTDVFESSSEVMALEVFNRAYGRIMNNEANKTLLDVARNDKTNEFVRVKESKEDHIPSGWQRVFVYEKGQRKSLYLSSEMSKEWITNSPEMSYKMSQVLRYSSGSPVLRTFATGINWGFALANLPRDVMHTWFAARTWKDGEWSGVYNPVAPVFGLQIGADLTRTFSDALLRKGRYEDYIKEGGGMEFLVHQGRLFQRGRHLEGSVDKIMNFMGYFGETSEIMTRLAIRDRVIRNRAKEQGITYEQAVKNKKITSEATFAARDYMDFGQGGGIAKGVDNAIPYLNATIQGTRGLIRSFKPGSGTALSSTFKLSQFAALTTGVYLTAKAMSPKTMENMKGNIDAENNLIIPLGDDFGFEDEKGQVRYPYIKIPLDPGQRFFKTFFEASADKWLGNEIDVDRVVESLKNQSPVGVTSLPPTVSGALGYVTNKNFWRNEDVWRKTDKPFSYPNSKEEYIPGQTPQAYIDLGQKTGLSPERSKYAVEQLLTGGTEWSYLLGKGYEEAFGDLPKSDKEKHLAEVLAKTPISKRFIGITNPYSKHAQKVDKAGEESVVERFVQNRGLDSLAEGYLYKGNVSREEVVKYMGSFKDLDTFKRLKERFAFQEVTKGLPERAFWMRLQGVSVEARAKVFVERLKSSSPEQQEQLWKEYAIVSRAGGIVSKSFREEVAKLR